MDNSSNEDSTLEPKYPADKVRELWVKRLEGATQQFAGALRSKATDIANNATIKREVNKQIANAGILSNKIRLASRSVASAIKEKSHDLAARNMIAQEIEHKLLNSDMPQFIKQFLQDKWSQLMLMIYMKQGTDNNAWDQSLIVIDDLRKMMSSRNFIMGKDRPKRMQYLIQRLKNGMCLIGLPTEDQDQFIRQVSNYNDYLVDKAIRIQKKSKAGQSFRRVSLNSDAENAGHAQPFSNELLVDNKYKTTENHSKTWPRGETVIIPSSDAIVTETASRNKLRQGRI